MLWVQIELLIQLFFYPGNKIYTGCNKKGRTIATKKKASSNRKTDQTTATVGRETNQFRREKQDAQVSFFLFLTPDESRQSPLLHNH